MVIYLLPTRRDKKAARQTISAQKVADNPRMKGPVLEMTLALRFPTMTEDPTDTAPARHYAEPIGNLPVSTPLIGSERLTPAKAVTARNSAAM